MLPREINTLFTHAVKFHFVIATEIIENSRILSGSLYIRNLIGPFSCYLLTFTFKHA